MDELAMTSRVVIALAAMMIAVGFAGGTVVWALMTNRERADSGMLARDLQCAREPVASKIARAAYAVRKSLPAQDRITKAELARFLAAGPKDCP